MRPIQALRRYMAADDARVADANLIAMVLAWNTPFYPLYVLASAGQAMQPGAWLTLAIFPVFLLVPAVSRRYPIAGRALLSSAGLANTVFCTWLLGEGSGTPLFLVACVALAPMVFRTSEPKPLLLFLILPILVGSLLPGNLPASPFACIGQTCDALFWLNAISVGILLGFFALLTFRRFAASNRSFNR